MRTYKSSLQSVWSEMCHQCGGRNHQSARASALCASLHDSSCGLKRLCLTGFGRFLLFWLLIGDLYRGEKVRRLKAAQLAQPWTRQGEFRTPLIKSLGADKERGHISDDGDGKFMAGEILSFDNLGAFVSFRGAVPPVVKIGTVCAST
jgi:hypothetical protein